MSNEIFLIGLGVVIPILLWVGMKCWSGNKEKLVKIREYPIDKRNRQKELDLLDSLLEDIKDNTHHWTYTGYNISSQANACIINDVKNIAIIMNETSGLLRTTSSIAVNFGQKDIANYRETSAENLSIHMQGKHVTAFCVQVEDTLDSRGHELDFFKEQITNKL